MDEQLTAEEFETHRPRLHAVAQRVLGSSADADDAVQEAWLRLSRAGDDGIDNLGAWLSTVVARISLDLLRSRGSRREDLCDPALPGREPRDDRTTGLHRARPADPAVEAELADSVGTALLVVLDSLSPAERLAFVLHDLFGLPFDEIAEVLGRSPVAARQLASRARRRVRSAQVDSDVDRARQRRVVEAFLAASRQGDFAALLELLDPDVVVRADPAAVAMGGAASIVGRPAVAARFNGSARAARLAVLGAGATAPVGAVWTLRGEPKVAFAFTLDGERITAIDLIADPEWLATTELTFVRD
ncbi:MAG: polymerase, sigma-24 subunit, subfamily [Humibacillus sp.]|nr:polymerase, sigma-24 subunit, subfamily [Humibacillus sp.]